VRAARGRCALRAVLDAGIASRIVERFRLARAAGAHVLPASRAVVGKVLLEA
jgi:hypothetical protein